MVNINRYNYRKIEKSSTYYLNIFNNSIIKSKKKVYKCISMFPYPSGLFHIGHFRTYIISDIINRYLCIVGYKSIGLFSWDSFGLPAENYSIKNNVSPFYWTNRNIFLMTKQLMLIFIFINWRRQFTTNNNRFCRINQYLFNIFYSNNIIIYYKSWVNWDSYDLTELSNEQCINNLCWRSNTLVTKKYLYCYFINIVLISKFLVKYIDSLSYPFLIKKNQLKWINLRISKYILFIFNSILYIINIINIFSLLYNIAVMVPLNNYIFFLNISLYTLRYYSLGNYFNDINIKIFSGLYFCIYLGSIFYIPIYYINSNSINIFILDYLVNFLINFNLKFNNFFNYIRIFLVNLFLIKSRYIYNINNWCISRSRYWGTPVPIINCNYCSNYIINGLYYPLNVCVFNYSSKIIRRCSYCNKLTLINNVTIDTFFDSSWYFIFYFTKLFLYKRRINLNINLYIGGREHSLLHFLYVRIMFYYLFLLKIILDYNPFNNILCLGLVLTKIYILLSKKKYILRKYKYIIKYNLYIYSYIKMSKSIGNNINPIYFVNNYGSDVLRAYIISFAPIYKDIIWTDNKIIGTIRFINKIWLFFINLKLNYIIKYYNKYILFRLYKKILLNYYLIYCYYKLLKFNLIISIINIQINNMVLLYNMLFNSLLKYILFNFLTLLLLFLYPICPNLSILILNILYIFIGLDINLVNLYNYYL